MIDHDHDFPGSVYIATYIVGDTPNHSDQR